MHNKTILVTGGCGYLGSQLIRDLAQLPDFTGGTVRILDNLSQGHQRALMDLPGGLRYEFVEGDILDPTTVELALQDVDTVIHLAAVVRTPLSFDNPAWLEQVNHWGTAHLVNACLAAGVRRLIYTSSTAVYGPGGPFDEADVCRPQGHYAQSKLRAEAAVQAGQARGLEVVTLRLGVLYGLAPVARFDAVANRFAYLAGVGRAVTVFGDGAQRRPFLHVWDASAAVMHALTLPSPLDENSVFNVVGENVTVTELVSALQRIRPDVQVRYTEQDIRTHYSFDVSGTRFATQGWEAKVTLDIGLAEVMAHFVGLHAPRPLVMALE